MSSRAILIISAAGAALALAGCSPHWLHGHRGAYRAVNSLDCPETVGALSRKTASPDGKSCDYTGPNGEAVGLQLVSLQGVSASDALAPLEAKLRAEAPAAAQAEEASPAKGEGRVDIDLPGIHIHAAGNDKSDNGGGEVRIGRDVTISDGGNTVATSGDGGSVDIRAHDKGAEVRVDESHGNVRRDFILASDTPGPNGYRVAGYSARGPEGGPLVVASLLAKTDDHDRLDEDIHELLRDNIGGGGR
ncbi:MAG TPA: hypothetical protein VGG68_02945 [Caulobacteraceae bacterium]|jgi:hypothetical protein